MVFIIIKGHYPPKKVTIIDLRSLCSWKIQHSNKMQHKIGIDIYTLLCINRYLMRIYCVAQGTLLSALWRPKWERNLKKRGYMYTYN